MHPAAGTLWHTLGTPQRNTTSLVLATSPHVTLMCMYLHVPPCCTAPQASISVDLLKPTGQASWTVSDVTQLGSGGTAIADVFVTTAYSVFSAAEQAAIQAFVLGGGGVLIGGQGGSWTQAGKSISSLPGNVLMAPLNVVTWTDTVTTGDL